MRECDDDAEFSYMSGEEPVHVLVTGAAGQIGYVLAFKIANGDLFGDRKVVLHLLEIRTAMPMLESLVTELNDCSFPNLHSVIGTSKINEAFKDVDYAFLLGSLKKSNISQETYIERNCVIMKEAGEALSQYSKPTVKVLVVGLPANTNCLICAACAKRIPKENFCAMMRLDHNRVTGELSRHLGVPSEAVQRVIVWGNRSKTQFPDASHILCNGEKADLSESFLEHDLPEWLDGRNTRVGVRSSTSASAAHAAVQCMRDWVYGTAEGDFVSMAVHVPDSEPYGIRKGIVYSMPCTVDKDGTVHVVEDLELTDTVRQKIKENEDEIRQEADIAISILKKMNVF